jgi:hypothetical protein
MSTGTEPKIEKAAKKSAAKKPSRHVRGHRRAIWGLRRCRSCVWARGTWKDSQVKPPARQGEQMLHSPAVAAV